MDHGMMEVLSDINFSDIYLAKLAPDTEVLDEFNKIAKKLTVKQVVVLSALGSLKNVRYRDIKTKQERPITVEDTNLFEKEGPFEVLNLQGNVLPEADGIVVHLHATLGDADGRAIGGHLLEAKVFTTLEVIIGIFGGEEFIRKTSKATGLQEIKKLD